MQGHLRILSGCFLYQVKITSKVLLPSLSEVPAASPSPLARTPRTRLLEEKQSRVSCKLQNVLKALRALAQEESRKATSELAQGLQDGH